MRNTGFDDMVILLELWVAGATARTLCEQAWPGLYFFRRQKHVPGADYLTQNLAIEQTVIGRGVSALKIAGFRSRRGVSATTEARSATPMKQIVNDDWTVGVVVATL
jgi:hypothetical protein